MVNFKKLAGQPAKQVTLQERIEGVPAAQDAFDTRVRSGCQPGKLRSVLEIVFRLLEDADLQGPKLWRGYGKDLPRRLGDLKAVAGILETLNNSVLGKVFMATCHADQRECLRAIPALLRGYSGWLERSWKNLPKRLGRSLPIAALMQYVHRATGRWDDPEVADLLGIAGDMGKLMFNADDLKSRRSEWQRENPGLWKGAGAFTVSLTH